MFHTRKNPSNHKSNEWRGPQNKDICKTIGYILFDYLLCWLAETTISMFTSAYTPTFALAWNAEFVTFLIGLNKRPINSIIRGLICLPFQSCTEKNLGAADGTRSLIRPKQFFIKMPSKALEGDLETWIHSCFSHFSSGSGINYSPKIWGWILFLFLITFAVSWWAHKVKVSTTYLIQNMRHIQGKKKWGEE